ncbi:MULTISPECIES: hypothetical protein [unclassified Clostridium]|uniref:hypothetical protein n=1 Tax=Clostridium TaxID=1485 RepID=UPI001C8CAD43|nr:MULTISPECIES: hypothetical protein [unclassified Clostridium]MBX9136597.1 hypothetical protein [Clostridium sp. K12(2020)]MBX9144791.1 hypothetical protein [Clostridium sp. K13]MDU2288865.1 hypothetical protein [Clostridium celatum]
MALCLRPTANDYIVTTSANLPSPVTIPGGLSLNLTCKKDAVENSWVIYFNLYSKYTWWGSCRKLC